MDAKGTEEIKSAWVVISAVKTCLFKSFRALSFGVGLIYLFISLSYYYYFVVVVDVQP